MTCQGRRATTVFGALLLVAAFGCSRSGLLPGELEGDGGSGGNAGSAGLARAGTSGQVDAPDASPAGSSGMPSQGSGPSCQPTDETCNGVDDDCNGVIDDLPSVPCPGGGERYCVGGHLSECPRRCEVCVPGSVRICMHSFCKFWGEQECAGDGQSFGSCREAEPPAECAGVASAHHKSAELEQCCLDNGYCCADEFDLDHDGVTAEVLGVCDNVVCQ